MQLATFAYTKRGWEVPSFPELDSPQTLVLIFGASGFMDHPAPIIELASAYPQAHILGCSTAGEILGANVHDESLVVSVVRFEHTRLAGASATARSGEESYEAGRAIADQLRADDLRGVLLLSDGTSVNGSELLRGLNSVVDPSVVVSGGLAGDGARFQRTWVIQERRPVSHVVAAVGFYGDRIVLGHGSRGGWDIFGPERTVTRSAGNVLYELDGQPALQLYKKYLGERAAGLPATALLFPLGLRARGEEKTLVRTILGIDEEAQSMTFAGDIPQGGLVQLMRANLDRLVDGASDAGQRAHESVDLTGPSLAIAISCVGRRLVLGERAEEEIEAALEALPPETNLVGFYSYGEISPYASGRCDLHNQTMTLTLIAER